MRRCVVFDDQLLFGYALAAAVQRHSGRPTLAVSDMQRLGEQLARGDVRTVILGLRSDATDARSRVTAVRAQAARVHLLCLVAGDARAVERAALAAGADAVLPRTRYLRDVVAHSQPGTRPPRRSSSAGLRDRRDPLTFLTPREHQTLQLLLAARSTPAMAAEMGITTATARNYVQSVLEKLGVHSRVEAVSFMATRWSPSC